MVAEPITLPEMKRLDDLENRIIQLQIDALKKASEDHELRIRVLESTAAKTNVLLMLTTGAGIVGLANLAVLLFGGG